jgi:stearoyl-CoA desaturase (delta-9 desaturase)
MYDERRSQPVATALQSPPSVGEQVGPGDIQPASNESVYRTITGIVTIAPFVGLGLAAWQLWDGLLHPSDLIVFAIMYLLTGLAITVGFHRLFTHRSFKTYPAVRGIFAVLGSVAIEGPVISWVADHRKHHAFSDQHGDPHSPHVDAADGWRGVLRGLGHAHVGWLFIHTQRGCHERYAADLIADPVVSFVSRTFLFWAIGGLALAFGLGYAIGGTVDAGLTGLLWGGAIRMLVVHHVTYSTAHVWRGVAQQPPRLPDLCGTRLWLAPARRVGARDSGHGRSGPGVGRGVRTRGAQARKAPGSGIGLTAARGRPLVGPRRSLHVVASYS